MDAVRRRLALHETKNQNVPGAKAMAPWGTVAARTDNDITDDASGARRVELKAASVSRKRQEALELEAQNAAMRNRNAKAGLRTDADITDEAAGVARVELAAASKARKERERRELAKRNAELKARRDASGARDDHDITDEAAGLNRVRLAHESRQRRAAEAKMLAQANAEMRERLHRMRPRTDNRSGNADTDMVRTHSPVQDRPPGGRADEDAEEAAEVARLREMLAHTASSRKQRNGWDSSPARPVPYALRGLKPLYTYEPWGHSAMEAWVRLELKPSTSYATSGLCRLDDGLNDDLAQLFNRRKREDAEKAELRQRRPWDSSQWRYTPPSLRGLRPVTAEPWARDAETNEGIEVHQDLLEA